MNASTVPTDLNLRRGHFFNRKRARKRVRKFYRKNCAPASDREREEFRRRLRREIQAERWQMIFGLGLMILFSVIVYWLM